MWIRAGSLQAGSSSEPFPGNFTIEIRGNRDDVGIVIDENIAGNKMIVVTGELLLYGNAPSTTWTRLA